MNVFQLISQLISLDPFPDCPPMHSPGHIACQRPVLPVGSQDLMRFMRSVDPLVCDHEQDWVLVSGSVAAVTDQAIKDHGQNINCAFTGFTNAQSN